MSDTLPPHRWQPTRLLCPWDSPGKNTGVGCHFLLQCVKVKSASHVRISATPRTAAYQVPPSLGFSRQEYWSGLPLPVQGSLVLKDAPFLHSHDPECLYLDTSGFIFKCAIRSNILFVHYMQSQKHFDYKELLIFLFLR